MQIYLYNVLIALVFVLCIVYFVLCVVIVCVCVCVCCKHRTIAWFQQGNVGITLSIDVMNELKNRPKPPPKPAPILPAGVPYGSGRHIRGYSNLSSFSDNLEVPLVNTASARHGGGLFSPPIQESGYAAIRFFFFILSFFFVILHILSLPSFCFFVCVCVCVCVFLRISTQNHTHK